MSNHSGHSGDEDCEPSPLEYARLNGLSRDYLAEPYLVPNFNMLDGQGPKCLTDDSNLSKFQFPDLFTHDERLTISKEGAQLLASVSRADTFESIDTLVAKMLGGREVKNPRLELPVLRSDHETDCQRFGQREGFETKLRDVKLPLEVVDEENNPGLWWSPKLWNLGAETIEGLKREKLEVSRDTIRYLHNIMKNSWTEADELELWACLKQYKKNSALKPVTPPLSPMALPRQLYEPSMSSPTFQLPILSDPASLTSQDLENIERCIFEQDLPTPIRISTANHEQNSADTLYGNGTVKLRDIYSPLASLDSPLGCSPIETQQSKYKDLKVEEPLTPPSRPVTLPKSVHFSDIITDCPLAIGSPPAEADDTPFFDEAFGCAYERATQLAEQETLIEADATARVDVPIMDFSLPDPPWTKTKSDQMSSTIWQADEMEAALNQIPRFWRGSRQDEIKLRWHPFSHNLAKVALEEKFTEDDASWSFFVNDPGHDEVIDTSTLTWKPPGLRILRDEDDADEIELGEFPKGIARDFSFLLQKRKIEIEERCFDRNLAKHDLALKSTSKQAPEQQIPKPNDFISAAQKLQLDRSDAEISGLLMGGAFSVENSVDNYLEIRGTKKQKLLETWHFSKTTEQAKASTEAAHKCVLQPSMPKSPAANTDSLPTPSILIPRSPISIMVSSTLLKHRALINQVEVLIPHLTLIERDFSAHNQTVWMPHSVTRSPLASALAFEADIIVSPLVGIIITTLQKIKQKPLPGQKTKPIIRERLEKVSVRYENLIVLVSEGREDAMASGLDENDCIAFSEFVGFSLCLETAITVQLVGGGERTMAKWLVNAIVQHSCGQEPLQLETYWELFLRRAGLNAFAAQVIIQAVKAPDCIDPMTGVKAGQFGLAGFMEMTLEHRIARFGPVCGKRLLERVSAAVDARWE